MIHYRFRYSPEWYATPFAHAVHKHTLATFIQKRHNVKHVYVNLATDTILPNTFVEVFTAKKPSTLETPFVAPAESIDIDAEFGPDPFSARPATFRNIPAPTYADDFAMDRTDGMILRFSRK